MNRTQRIKVLGLLSLPLLAIALAVMVFSMGHSTDTAEAATDGAAMSMAVSGGQTCPGAKAPGDVCVPIGSAFSVTVSGDAVPITNGYVGAQAFLFFGATGLTATGSSTIWGDCAAADLGTLTATTVGRGCLTGLISPPISVIKGALFQFDFTCTTGKSQGHQIDLETLGGPNAGTSGAAFADAVTGNIAVPGSSVTVHCTNANTATPTPTFTPTPTSTPTNTPPPVPRMSKIPALQNVFLTRQGSKVPPVDCLSGTNIGSLSEELSQAVVSPDPKGVTGFQVLAAFEFEVLYDNKKVCVDLTTGADWQAAGAICIIQDSASKPQLEGVARIGCVTVGKAAEVDRIDNLASLATVDVYPQPEIYSPMKPNQENGNVVQINNVNCDLGDEQGEAIPIFACDDADITFRYLEGDVEPDCSVDALDAQAISFRWGVEKGSLIYKDFMNLEPSGTQSDADIDINDLQFVFGRFGSTCAVPHPPQPPVNPKA